MLWHASTVSKADELAVLRDRIAEAAEQRRRFEETWLADMDHAATGLATREGDEAGGDAEGNRLDDPGG
jgi:hypothetical protein